VKTKFEQGCEAVGATLQFIGAVLCLIGGLMILRHFW